MGMDNSCPSLPNLRVTGSNGISCPPEVIGAIGNHERRPEEYWALWRQHRAR